MKTGNLLKLLALSMLIAFPLWADEPGIEDKVTEPAEKTAGLGLERASGERLASASGHYARSRSLLIAAINEFDKGYKIAHPDAILNSREWRATLIDRAEELQKVLDPQPRLTRGGVKFEADTRLLKK